MTLIESVKRMITRDKSTSIDEQMTSLNNEIEVVQQKIDGINERIEQLDNLSEHTRYGLEEGPKTLDKARYRLREHKERDIEQDATREIERVNYLRTLETNLAQLEREIPAHLASSRNELASQSERRVALERELGEHQAVLRELQSQLRGLQDEMNARHRAAGEACYDQLLQGFNELAKQERELIARALEAKAALLKKSEEATRSLSSWPGLARQFSDETAQTVKVSQSETINASEEGLKLARARAGMLI